MGESLIDQALRREVITTFGDPSYRPPPLPTVAIRLATLSRDDDASLEDVVRLLEQDQVLAGIAMRIVSSPHYAGRARITSLHQAVVRIGLAKLRSIVFEATLRGRLFDVPEYREAAERVSRHGTTAAYIARIVCQECGLDPENGFLCGLLHDVGFSALLLSVTRRATGAGPGLSGLWADIDKLHEQATGIVARLWVLPSEITEVVAHHHHPERGTITDAVKIAAAVCVADSLTPHFGAAIAPVAGGDPDGDKTSEATLASARDRLSLDDGKLAKIIGLAEETLREILREVP